MREFMVTDEDLAFFWECGVRASGRTAASDSGGRDGADAGPAWSGDSGRRGVGPFGEDCAEGHAGGR